MEVRKKDSAYMRCDAAPTMFSEAIMTKQFTQKSRSQGLLIKKGLCVALCILTLSCLLAGCAEPPQKIEINATTSPTLFSASG